jgi:hypothetical protein
MRRTPLFFAFAGLELIRYFTLVNVAGPFSAPSVAASQILRLLAAPNILFAAAFFFLAIDRERYAVYQPLLILGKAVSLFSAAFTIPGMLGTLFSGASAGFTGWAVIPIMGWDLAAALVLLLWKTPETEHRPPPSPEPELVETE